MPIKLPKGFTRRKSSGNVLDEVESPPQPSFRVFERSSGDRKSVNDASFLSRRVTEPPQSSTEDTENIFAGSERLHPQNRGSGGTDRSGIAGGVYESSSSVRFSSSSTCPSSAETPQDDPQSSHSRALHDIPPPRVGALRSAGRTFSLGARLSKVSTPPPPPPPQHPTAGPSRGPEMTASAPRAATPPNFLDTHLNLGNIGYDFNSVFDNIESDDSAVPHERSHGKTAELNSRLPLSSPTASPNEENISQSPTDANRSQPIDPSQSSWDNRRSEEGLLSEFRSDHQAAPETKPAWPQSDSIPNSRADTIPTTSHRSLERPVPKPGGALRRSLIHTEKRDSTFVDDEDANLVRQSLLSNKRATPAQSEPNQDDSDGESETSLFGNTTDLSPPEQREPVRASEPGQEPETSETQPDPSIAAHAKLAERFERSAPKSALSTNKVMTPSQFEHYRQQQELRRSNSDASKSGDSVESEFDEEDEAEKNREAERQRRKQEAHLSVYRQQMMKVTGQGSPEPSYRLEVGGTSSTPNLGARALNQKSNTGSGKSNEGDEDDDVPLAILAAHGFPNKSRPPTELGASKSIPNLRASFQPRVPSPGQMPAEQDQSNRNSLPAFAKNLPRDPYFGASLVNPPNRESLALGRGSPGQRSPSPALPPGGLVGVIASEERARAVRRGSPNTQGVYDHQPGMLGMNTYSNPSPAMPPNPPGMPGPQHGLSPVENSQMQLSQQMTQMMQTQMQWMQQMLQMHGMQGTPPPQVPRGLPPSPLANADMRPVSMPSGPALNAGPTGPRTDQRTLSMLDPNASRWKGTPIPYVPPDGNWPGTPAGQGYAPSTGPSERSSVGMTPRYRPVSTVQQEQKPNTFLSVTKPWGDENRKSISVGSQSKYKLDKVNPVPTVTVRAVSPGDGRQVTTPDPTFDDEADDDEGWAEMMKKRERKKDGWKAKRATTLGQGNLMNVVH